MSMILEVKLEYVLSSNDEEDQSDIPKALFDLQAVIIKCFIFHDADVNLIVTDDCMPGMTGAHLIIMIKLGCVNTTTFIYCNNSEVPEKQH
ncbi:hypothetical protein ACLB2K_016623 [Fragaria x ananassa]